MRAPRPLTASHFCHVICLSQSGEHGLSRTRPLRSVRPWESEVPIGLTDLRVRSASHAHRSDSTGRSNAFSREISQIAPRIGLSAGVVRSVCVRGRSDSQICEAVGVRKSCDLSESPIGLTDLRVRSASEESTASHAHGLRFESPK